MIQDFKVRSILQAIWGLVTIDSIVKDRVFLAGAIAENGVLKTNGGRVLSVVGSDGKKLQIPIALGTLIK